MIEWFKSIGTLLGGLGAFIAGIASLIKAIKAKNDPPTQKKDK